MHDRNWWKKDELFRIMVYFGSHRTMDILLEGVNIGCCKGRFSGGGSNIPMAFKRAVDGIQLSEEKFEPRHANVIIPR